MRYTIPGGSANTLIRFRYQTDGGVHLPGAFIDDITVKSGGTTVFSDDVEGGVNGWTADGGFKISTGTESTVGDRYYIAENRTYVGYDATLQTGPYQFSFGLTDPDKVEHFTFEDGLLVWMVDETYTDNNNSEHPGHGLALPVDARPVPFTYGERGPAEQPPAALRCHLRPAGRPRWTHCRPGAGGRRFLRPAALRRSAHAGRRREGEGPVDRVPVCLADRGPARGHPGLQRLGRRRLLGRHEPAELHEDRPATAPRSRSRVRTPAGRCR